MYCFENFTNQLGWPEINLRILLISQPPCQTNDLGYCCYLSLHNFGLNILTDPWQMLCKSWLLNKLDFSSYFFCTSHSAPFDLFAPPCNGSIFICLCGKVTLSSYSIILSWKHWYLCRSSQHSVYSAELEIFYTYKSGCSWLY